VPVPEEFGGHGFPLLVGTVVMEMLNAANMAWTLCPLLTQSAIDALIHHGTPEQQATYLPNLLTGQWSGTMNLTEAHAGSDVGALRTRAEPADDGSWRIKGTKIFITYGEHDMAENIIHMVLARTPGSPPGTKGISLFIVPKFLVNEDGSVGERNDVFCASLEHKMGIHGSPTAVMHYGENSEGAVGYMIGSENEGMRAMFTMMNGARLAVGNEGLGIADRAYQQAVIFAQERHQGRAIGSTESSPIIDHPDVRRMLMTMKAYIEAMRCVIYADAAFIDRSIGAATVEERTSASHLAALFTPISKAWCSDLGCEVASLALQVHGGMGFIEETGAAQHYRDARIAPIYEGTNGIQAIDLVMRKLPLENGDVIAGLITDVRDTVDSLAHRPNLASKLRSAVDAVETATAHLMASLPNDPNQALAGATPFLRLLGTVLGGHFMGQSLVAAESLADARDGDQEFLEAKIATASFYLDQLLPQAIGLVDAIVAPDEALFAIEPKYLVG
ncbi:MAG: acyl-CoA dehydrogenase, partial [Acidimicrobiia bacterium]|nr:acyl-CoA dehydrogenase [Acidimicrobiia bacterium]